MGYKLPPCIVMERGESLDEWSKRRKPDVWAAMPVRNTLQKPHDTTSEHAVPRECFRMRTHLHVVKPKPSACCTALYATEVVHAHIGAATGSNEPLGLNNATFHAIQIPYIAGWEVYFFCANE
jgi:hypothetical protein